MNPPPPGPERFRDLFSRDAAGYAKFRPRYPAELFAWLATLPAARRLALDCATGNGQAATMLTPHFESVVGTDASRAQLRAAARVPRVGYVAAPAEKLPVRSQRADLICVAQALHWLDRPRFYGEVGRVAAPGAVLAIWGYGRLRMAPALEDLINHFHDVTVGPYWSPERHLVEAGYRGLHIPIDELRAPPFAMTAQLTLDELLGYLRTWSAVGKYQAEQGRDPVESFAPRLAPLWGDSAARREIVWPMFVRAGLWRGP